MALSAMSSSTKILIGLLSGVLVGLFLGEHTAIFNVAADGFVKLLQICAPLYHVVDRHEPGELEFRRGEDSWSARWSSPCGPVVSGIAFHVPHSFGVSGA